MRRLFYGGSFNPIHHGHLLCSQSVAEARGFDRIVLVPSAQPPHKSPLSVAPAADRLAMCRLAVEGSNCFEVNDIELKRPGPSYTLDTARELTSQGFGRICWLIGADTVGQLLSWHEPRALLAEVDFLVMARPNYPIDWGGLPAEIRFLREKAVVAPQLDISATHLRERAREGRALDFFTPPAVAAYIARKGLYRPDPSQ